MNCKKYLWSVIERNKETDEIVSVLEDLSIIEAELIYFKISMSDLVKSGIHYIDMERKEL